MRTTKNSWLRTSTLLLLSLGIAYGAQSFTEKDAIRVEKKADFVEWKYDGTSNSSSQSLNANQYSPAGAASCGGTEQTICKIYAPEDLSNPGHPDLGATVSPGVTVADEISNSLATATPTRNNTVIELRSF